jgi:hypothetical protein
MGKETAMTLFVLLSTYGAVDDVPPMTDWDPRDARAHLDFLTAVNRELADNGELVEMRALTGRTSPSGSAPTG